MRKSNATAALAGVVIAALLLVPDAILSDTLIFTADTGNNRIQVFNSEGDFLIQWGKYGKADGDLLSPSGIASGSHAYVADTGNNRVQKFKFDGTWISTWGGTASGQADGMFSFPASLAVNEENCSEYVYVADTGNNRIQKFTSDGAWIASWPGAVQFNNPQGISADPSGRYIYVADTGNDLIQKLDTQGNMAMKFGGTGTADGKFNYPRDVAVDSLGRVYVADNQNYRIQRFSSDGVFELKWGSEGEGNGQFFDHYGIAVDGRDNIYAADAGNNRVQVFTCDGVWIKTIGGTIRGTDEAEFYYPMGVDVYFDKPLNPACVPTLTFTETFADIPTDTATETYTETHTETPTDTATETYTETHTETPTDTATETYTGTYTETPTDTATVPAVPTIADTVVATPAVTAAACSMCYSAQLGNKVNKTCDIPAVEEKNISGKNNSAEKLNVFEAPGGGYVYMFKSSGLKICVYDAQGCFFEKIMEMEKGINGKNARDFTAWYVKHLLKKTVPPMIPAEYYVALLFPDSGYMNLDTKGPHACEEMSGANTYNYPNPCGGRTSIRFALPESRAVDIVVSDVAGRHMWKKHLQPFQTVPGVNYVLWEGMDDRGMQLANGTYILRVMSGGKIVVKKISIAR